jgi:hypothetical protein
MMMMDVIGSSQKKKGEQEEETKIPDYSAMPADQETMSFYQPSHERKIIEEESTCMEKVESCLGRCL